MTEPDNKFHFREIGVPLRMKNVKLNLNLYGLKLKCESAGLTQSGTSKDSESNEIHFIPFIIIDRTP